MASSLFKESKRNFHNDDPKIKIVGVGGAGTNIIDFLYSEKIKAELISINTDWKQLSLKKADKKLLIGFKENKGYSTGGDISKGKQAAKENIKEIREILKDTEMIIFVGALGKGTCSGALPTIAREAKKQGALVVSFLAVPFFLRSSNIDKTEYSLSRLKEDVDTLILVDNNKLTQLDKNISLLNALNIVDKMILTSINALISLIREQEIIEVNFSSLKNVLSNKGLGIIGISQVDNSENIDKLVNESIGNNLSFIDPEKSKHALVQIIGGPNLNLKTLKNVTDKIQNYMTSDYNVTISAKIDKKLEDDIKAVIILTGISHDNLNLRKEIIKLDDHLDVIQV
ncbi:cell division protein FtsZ [Candidatus Aenigmatarchaeota archaeon]